MKSLPSLQVISCAVLAALQTLARHSSSRHRSTTSSYDPTSINTRAVCAIGLSLLSVTSLAFDPFQVKEIRVEGIQRTETGTVFNYLPVKVGDQVDAVKIKDAITALFATGFYNDVRIEAEGTTLIVSVDERPVVAGISVEGAREIEPEQLLKALRENGLAESRTFDRALLESAEFELKKQYFSRGRYSVRINTKVTRLERNRVVIAFDISEGEAAKIRQVNIVGNQTFSEKELLSVFQLTTPGWLTWYSKNDQYSKPKLQADIEALRSYYLDRGYLEFAISSQQVALSDDKKDVFLTVNISEGQKYTVSSVKLAGDTVIPEAELQKLIDIVPGEVFARARINAVTERITARLSDEGYAFSNVNPIPDIDKTNATAAFTLYVDPGRKTYIRRVNIIGNTRTRDEVIRREMRVVESSPFNGSKIKRSKERLDLLGYFSEVNVETPLVPDTTDQVDVNVTVTEKQTGNIQVGAGYSQNDGAVLSGTIAQSNIFGSGNFLKLELSSSKSTKIYAMSFTNPYATPDGVARGFDIYRRKYQPSSDAVVGLYTDDSLGFGLRWSIPVSEYNSIETGLSVQRSKLTVYSSSPQSYISFVNKNGSENITFLGTLGWAQDTRDSALFPTKGILRRISSEIALPGGTIKYLKLTGQQQWFTPVTKDITLLWNAEAGYAKGYGGTALPFYSNFFAGGPGSVRGYQASSLGPQDVNGGSIGGNRRVINNLELLFALPGQKSDKSVQLSAFFDSGYIWGEGDRLSVGDLRYSTGVALSWLAPVGPMKFSLAKPIRQKAEDKIERFQFTLGKIF